jgi:hypothetical protein
MRAKRLGGLPAPIPSFPYAILDERRGNEGDCDSNFGYAYYAY